MNEFRHAASTLSHILNPSRSRGALEQRESPPLPSTLVHRRRHHRRRLQRHVHDASALLVAAFERISINEPVMAGPSFLQALKVLNLAPLSIFSVLLL